jgi:carnitine-CoA ligase
MSDSRYGPGEPLPWSGYDTLAIALRRHSAARADQVFVTFEDATSRERQVTFAELAGRAERVARLLRSAGVGHGDRFHVHLPNCVEFLECLFGAALLGAVMVPTSPDSTPDDLAFVLSHSQATVSITQPDLLPGLIEARDMAPELGHILLARSTREAAGTRLLEQALAEQASAEAPLTTCAAPGDTVVILYTSGTSGWPKGVEVSQASLLFAGQVVAQSLRLRPEDRWLVTLPLFHGNALYYSTMSALVTGASMALAERFDPSRFAAQARHHGATLTSLFATQLRMVLSQPPGPADGAGRLRATVFAQNLADRQRTEFEDRFGCPLVQLYGMTETVAPPLINPLYGERRNASLGRPVIGVPLRVVGRDGREVAPGQTGELLVGGIPGVTFMRGYFNNAQATQDVLRGGWLRTGDYVHTDPDGYCYFDGRGSDLLKPQVDNVSTAEIERVVMENWAVHECVAVGVPDPIQAEAIKVYVVRQPGEPLTREEVFDWCAKRLAEHKRPSLVEFVDTLPRTPVGKVDRHALSRTFAARGD